MSMRVLTGTMILTAAVVLVPVPMSRAADVPVHPHPPHYKTCMAVFQGNEAHWRNFRTSVPRAVDPNYCAELSARYGGTHARLGCRDGTGAEEWADKLFAVTKEGKTADPKLTPKGYSPNVNLCEWK